MHTVTWQGRGTSCNRKKGRWPGLLPCLLNAAGTHPLMGRTGSGTNTTGYPPILGNSRVHSTNPASANPQVHSRGNRLVGLPTEESHDFSRGRRSTTPGRPQRTAAIGRFVSERPEFSVFSEVNSHTGFGHSLFSLRGILQSGHLPVPECP